MNLAWSLGVSFRNVALSLAVRMALRNQQPLIVGLALLLAGGVAAVKTAGVPWHRAIVPKAVEVFFSPHGGCTEAVVEALRGAKKTVLVQAYSFTNVAIARALVEAHRRGVRVEVILDKSVVNDKYNEGDFVAHAGIPTWVDGQHAIAHNKVMVIDGQTVITGSFNFTKAAEEHNAENLLVIHETPDLARLYVENWEQHKGHSVRYAGR
jgi:phosphatidylserine/phosphatidylglycerophosphate/cardiolipin synthase-like enzyme